MAYHKIVVTGADGDIGRAVCLELVNRGYEVLAIDRVFRDRNWITKKIEAIVLDLTQFLQVTEFKDDLVSKKIRFDGLVNNAGVYPIKRVHEYDLLLWNQVLDINLTAPFLLTELFSELLIDGGAIVNVSSTGAHLGSRDPGYSASKAGLLGLTKSYARGFSDRKIRVNAVAPGMIETQMSRRMKHTDRQKNIENSLLGRIGRPEEVAKVVAFLISDDSSYITGTTLDVNGGLYLR